MKKVTIICLILGTALIVGTITILKVNHGAKTASAVSNDSAGVNTEGGAGNIGTEQVIEISAKGGYTLSTSRAKADEPVVLKIKTNGTFDCSAGIRIPSIGWSKHLNPTGETTVQIPAQKAGTILIGVCSMGMYNFKITFE